MKIITMKHHLYFLIIFFILCFSIIFVSACNSEKHIAPEMVLVQGGTFQMGDEIGDLWDGSRPVHTVNLTYNFYIGKYEITFDEYDYYCEQTENAPANDHGWGRGTLPVIYVSWRDAIDYCNWLSEAENLSPAYNMDGEFLDKDGNVTTDITRVEGYRLPTEAEWEYAASGGHEALPIPPRHLYSGGDNIDDVAWYFDNSGEGYYFSGTSLGASYTNHGSVHVEGISTQPVGEKEPNELGLHDMSGNVWEWCHDWYDLYTGEDKTNPIGAPSGHLRVMRGGSWLFGANDCRVGNRLYRPAHDKLFRIGFRIARTEP